MEKQNQQIQIKDESGDKSYFTIIPNFILNHSTANAQALYLQLKRLAGENGMAYPTLKYLIDKLGITRNTVRREMKYLLAKKWIKYVEDIEIETKGGKQKIKSYKIIDLWVLNNDYYRGEAKESIPDQRGGKIVPKGEAQRGGKITDKEEQLQQEPYQEEYITATQSVAGNEINLLIEKFKPINPTYERLFGNTTQRMALQRLLKKFGQEKLEQILDTLPKIFGKPYAPVITTPYLLEQKIGNLIAYLQTEKSKLSTITKINENGQIN